MGPFLLCFLDFLGEVHTSILSKDERKIAVEKWDLYLPPFHHPRKEEGKRPAAKFSSNSNNRILACVVSSSRFWERKSRDS